MAYGQKYKIPYRELHTSELWEFYIAERNYTGSQTELTGVSKPHITEYRPENDNDYDHIRPSICTVGMVSDTDMQFREFFTSDNRRYQGHAYRDGSLVWAGWIVPDAFKEPYISANSDVYITFTDGLLSLKGIDWDNKGTKYTGKRTLLQGLWDCLSKLELYGVSLWDASYIYELNHNKTAADSPLTQTYFNAERFYDEEDEPVDTHTVLSEILKSCNCQLWMSEGRWNLVPQNARKGSYTRRLFHVQTSLGVTMFVYQSNEVYNPGITVDNVNYIFYSMPEESFRPAWKEFNLKQDYRYNNNLLRNVDFQLHGNWSPSIDKNKFIFLTYSEALVTNNYLEWNLGQILENTTDNEFLNVEVKFYGPDDLAIEVMLLLDASGTDYTLASAAGSEIATWRTGTSYVYSMTLSGKASMNDDAEFIGFLPKKTNNIPTTGTLKLRIFQPHKLTGSTEVSGTCGFYIKDIKVFFSRNEPPLTDTLITTDINKNNTYVPETLEMMLGDLPYPYTRTEYWQPPVPIGQGGYNFLHPRTITVEFDNQSLVYDGGLYWLDGDTYTPTQLWSVKDRNQYNKLRNVIADEISVNHLDPQWIITGETYGYFGYGAILAVGTKKYMILRGSHNAYDKEWELELFEIADTEQGYLKLRTGGYVKLRGDGKIKIK